MYLRNLARRAVTLAAATVTVLGATSLVTAPAHAGQVGVTISITGAGSVRVVEGQPADGSTGACVAFENLDDPTATKTCSRIRSEAPFEAWLWLRPEPLKDGSGRPWKISPSGWQGCDKTRVSAQVTECGVHSGAFSSDERYPSIRFYDDAPPTLSTASWKASSTKNLTATLSFAANERSTAQCRFDWGQWGACASPLERTFDTDGEHRVDIQPIDLSGNAGEVYSRTVRLVDTVIEEAPPALSASTTARFVVSTGGGTSFQCALDGGLSSYCGDGPRATHTLTGLAEGEHRLDVWAQSSDASDPRPATHTWVVDTVAPETTITDAVVSGTRAGFDVSSPGSDSLECRLTRNGLPGAWTACGSSPVRFVDLADGSYAVEIRGKDAAGNVDATPASHVWTVGNTGPDNPGPGNPGPQTPGPQTPGGTVPDTTAPDTVLTSAPAEGAFVVSDRALLGWSATEPASSWSCTLDGTSLPCSGSGTELTRLGPGTHRFSVAAADAAGNRDATPATRTWTVPYASRTLEHGRGWRQKRSARAYAGSYAVSSTRGAVLSTRVRNARAIALVATTGRGQGTVKVYAGTRLLRTVRLSATKATTTAVLPVVTLPRAWSGKLRIVVAKPGKQVRIEGLGVRT